MHGERERGLEHHVDRDDPRQRPRERRHVTRLKEVRVPEREDDHQQKKMPKPSVNAAIAALAVVAARARRKVRSRVRTERESEDTHGGEPEQAGSREAAGSQWDRILRPRPPRREGEQAKLILRAPPPRGADPIGPRRPRRKKHDAATTVKNLGGFSDERAEDPADEKMRGRGSSRWRTQCWPCGECRRGAAPFPAAAAPQPIAAAPTTFGAAKTKPPQVAEIAHEQHGQEHPDAPCPRAGKKRPPAEGEEAGVVGGVGKWIHASP